MNALKTVGHSQLCPLCGNRIRTLWKRNSGDASCPVCGHPCWFRIQKFGHTVVINVLSSLDLEYSDIAQVVDFIIRQGGGTRVVVNLSLVQFIGSTFLGGLIMSKKKLAAVNGELLLCGFNSVIEEVFRVTRLDRFFEIIDEDAAISKQV